jgi:hypothetical protein
LHTYILQRICSRPAGVADQHRSGRNHAEQTQAVRLDVVHPDVPHADPGVVEQADEEQEGQELHEAVGENAAPGFEGVGPDGTDDDQEDDRVDRHDDGRGTLDDPVLEAVMGPDKIRLIIAAFPHMIRVSGMLTASTTPARLAGSFFSTPMQVEQQKADTGAEVVHVKPRSGQPESL